MLPQTIQPFQETVWEYYRVHGRHDLPWRRTTNGDFDPYNILVSEVMLQQTQVPRVTPKFAAFLECFPDFQSLAQAPLADVLRLWSGLGYNRRAKFLWQAAGIITDTYHGKLPHDQKELATLPGIGLATAGAILAYSFNQPVVFIETNVRTVFLHHFFAGQDQVPDKQIAQYVAETLPEKSLIREWYWALMDYGSYLKPQVGNIARFSANYNRQSRFEGSARQLRGAVLRLLADRPLSGEIIRQHIADERVSGILAQLVDEGLIYERDGRFGLGA